MIDSKTAEKLELSTYQKSDGWRIELPLAHVVHILTVEQAKIIKRALSKAIKSINGG